MSSRNIYIPTPCQVLAMTWWDYEPDYSIPVDANYNSGIKPGEKLFLGHTHSKETREKLRKANTGKKVSEETKRKLSIKSKLAWESGKMDNRKKPRAYTRTDEDRAKRREAYRKRMVEMIENDWHRQGPSNINR